MKMLSLEQVGTHELASPPRVQKALGTLVSLAKKGPVTPTRSAPRSGRGLIVHEAASAMQGESNRWLEHLFAEITQLRGRCDRLFDELGGTDQGAWMPAIDVVCPTTVVVRMDLPGVRRRGRPW